MEKIKVILADDHEILMDGMESILNNASHIRVVGKASSAAMAEKLVQLHQPALLMTDISMGEVSGLELTRRITHQYPLIKIIVLSMHDQFHHIASLLQAGAAGYLLKNIRQDELFIAIDNVMAGGQYIQQSLAGNFARTGKLQQAADQQSLLSPREIEIIRMIAQELTSAEISRRLFLSAHTVETHRKNIWRKTGVKTLIGLLNYARTNDLI